MKFLFYLLIITFLYADNQTAEEILLKSFHRMDGIDHRFKVDSKQSRKKKQERHYEVSVHWPSDGKFLRKIRITTILTKQKNPSSLKWL